MSAVWRGERERGSPRLMRLIAWLTLTFGRAPGRLLLGPICLYFIASSPRVRAALRTYLGRALGRRARFADVYRLYFTFAATLHDRIYLLAGRERAFDIRVEGAEALDAALAAGRGCLLLGAHLGSFEVLRAAAAHRPELRVNVLMHARHARKVAAVLDRLGPGHAGRVIPMGEPGTLLAVQECLARGEVVGILGDRVWRRERAVRCPFLGAPAPFPEGPLLLAGLLKAPVVLFFGLYRGGRRYRVHFEPFAECIELPRGRRAEALRPWLERYAARLEHYCREAPYNWFNFYDFWHEDAGDAAPR